VYTDLKWMYAVPVCLLAVAKNSKRVLNRKTLEIISIAICFVYNEINKIENKSQITDFINIYFLYDNLKFKINYLKFGQLI
jgi:hypothetical protein